MSLLHPKNRKYSSISEYLKTTNKDDSLLTGNETPKYRKLFVLLLTLNASLGSFYIGWSFGVLDTIQANLVQIFQWNNK